MSPAGLIREPQSEAGRTADSCSERLQAVFQALASLPSRLASWFGSERWCVRNQVPEVPAVGSRHVTGPLRASAPWARNDILTGLLEGVNGGS